MKKIADELLAENDKLQGLVDGLHLPFFGMIAPSLEEEKVIDITT